MKKLIKPYCLLFYLLALITSFFVGMTIAGIVEAGKNQGLAGGAIVFGYGVIGAFIGLLISLFIANKSNRKIIFRLNIILALCIAGFYGYYHVKYLERQKTKELEKQKNEQPKQKTSPAIDASAVAEPTAMLYKNERNPQTKKESGLGMFTPNFYDNKTLYFYGNLTPGKSVQEHMPIDSITFKQREYGGFDIATAPPWLVPDHLNLDYDILYFKVKSVSHDFIQVVVNTTNNQTTFVDRYAGKIKYWPEFLLGVHSVEFPNPESETIYIKPLDHAAKVNTLYSYMRPLYITNTWMHVELQDYDFKPVGTGWIKWIKDGNLLIRYSLLS